MNLYIYKILPGNHTKLLTNVVSKYIPRVGDYLRFTLDSEEHTVQVKYVCMHYVNDTWRGPNDREDLLNVTINVEFV